MVLVTVMSADPVDAVAFPKVKEDWHTVEDPVQLELKTSVSALPLIVPCQEPITAESAQALDPESELSPHEAMKAHRIVTKKYFNIIVIKVNDHCDRRGQIGINSLN